MPRQLLCTWKLQSRCGGTVCSLFCLLTGGEQQMENAEHIQQITSNSQCMGTKSLGMNTLSQAGTPTGAGIDNQSMGIYSQHMGIDIQCILIVN